MKNYLKYFLLAIIVAIPLGFLSSYRATHLNQYIASNQVKGSLVKRINVSQTIYSREPTPSISKILIEEGMTALDLLQKTTQMEKQGEGTNAFVTSINNVKADTGKKEYWSFSINSKPSMVGAGSYYLKDGDIIEWKLANY